MASQYLNWKLRDVKPDPLPPDPTPRQKWRNWWHYHKGMVIAGAVVGLAVLDIAHSALGLGQVRPDYQVAYVGKTPCPTPRRRPSRRPLPPWAATPTGTARWRCSSINT